MKWHKWDPTDYLSSEKDIKGYLREVRKLGDPALLTAAEADVERARERYHLAPKPSLLKQLKTILLPQRENYYHYSFGLFSGQAATA